MSKNNSIGMLLKMGVKDAIEGVKVLSKGVKGLTDDTNDLGSAIKKAFGQEFAFIGTIKSLKEIMNIMTKASEAEAEYVESMNLLGVAYRKDTEEGEKLYNQTNDLIDSMERLLGLDPAQLTQEIGIYKQMTSAMGMTNEQSALLSSNLIKLQQDVASLYNLQSSEVATKFQSALAGQTRAVRSLGADITQATLQQELYNLGIDKSFKELNRASKTMLIYLAIQRQLKNANGDASNTINSVANQMKIFREQVAMAGRQIGAVFIPILKTILPIANAILMVFNDIMEIILGLFGVDVQTLATEFGQKTVDIGEDFLDMSDNIESATKNAKKLLGLRGFDKLNNITTPQDSGSSKGGGIGAGGGIGGVDSALLDALKEYDLHLDEVKNKAREIADWIEKWLIYTDETGKHLTPLGKALVAIVGAITAFKIGKAIYTAYKIITKTTELLGGAKGIGLLKNIWNIIKTIGAYIELLFTEIIMPTLSNIAGWISSLGLGTVLAIIVGIVDGVGKIWGNLENIGEIIDKVKNGEGLFDAIFPDNIEELIDRYFYTLPLTGLLKVIDEVTGKKYDLVFNVKSGLKDFATGIEDKWSGITDWVEETWQGASEKIVEIAQGLFDILTNLWNTFISPIIEVITFFADWIYKTFIEPTIKTIGGFVDWLIKLFGEIFKTVKDVIGNIFGIIAGIVETIGILLKAGAEWLFNTIIKPIWEGIKSLMGDIFKIVSSIWNGIKDTVLSIWNAIKDTISDVWNGMINGAKEAWEGIKQVFKPFTDFFGSLLSKAWEKIKSAFTKGGQIFTGITTGIRDAFCNIVNHLIDGVNKVISIPFNAINKVLNKIKYADILGYKPFEDKIHEINIPEIPHLEFKAEGGFVDTGQLFVAREAGAEMVGQINGKTAVANNDQIVQGITNGVMIGVARAMASNSGTTKVVIEADSDTEGLMNFITFKQKEKDRQYGL